MAQFLKQMNFEKILKYQNIFFLILVLIVGIALLFPYHDFQLHLAQGDHGNNFYSFKKALDGQKPYRDFWWVYGPLMLYYYALFYKLLGVNIHSVLIGYGILNLLCGIVLYLSLKIFVKPLVALTGAVWFWVLNPPFEHTYNHIGGILMILIVLYNFFLYIQNPKEKYLFAGLTAVLLLCFIKINFGAAMLMGFVAAVGLADLALKKGFSREKKWFFLAALIGVPLLVVIVHWYLFKGLPVYVIRQCYPFLEGDQPYHSSVINSVKAFFEYKISKITDSYLLGFTTIITLAIGYFAACLCHGRIGREARIRLFAALGGLVVFIILNLNEYLLSAVTYRMYWAEPLITAMLFLILGAALNDLPKVVRIAVCVFIIMMAFSHHSLRSRYVHFIRRYMPLEHAKIYVGNKPQWLSTVTGATNYLNDHLSQNETFLALVDDQLYYFLTGKDSPYPLDTFSEHIKVQPEQEKGVIAALENKKVNYVLFSNRYKSAETGLGTFGETYCRLLSAYILQNYKPVAKFGPWEQVPQWVENHGVIILKRSEPFK